MSGATMSAMEAHTREGTPSDPTPRVDDERPITDERDAALPDHLDLPIETPEADAIEQRRIAASDDEDAAR